MKRSVFSFVFAMSVMALPLRGMGQDTVLKYTYRPEASQVSILKDARGKAYLPLVETAKFYGINLKFDSQTHQVHLSKGKSAVKLALSQPLFLASEPPESFPIDPVETVSGQLAIPPESAEDLLSVILNINVQYQANQGVLIVGGVSPQEVKEEIKEESVQSREKATPVPSATVSPETQDAVVSQPPSLKVKEEGVAGKKRTTKGEEAPPDNQVYRVRRVIIDAGHGGVDGGAKGYDRRFLEKQATLDMAKQVAKFLKKDPGLQVFLTRDRDKYITLKYRADFANTHQGDLFVSIHCNSNPHSKVSGTQVFVFSTKSSNKRAKASVLRENKGMNGLDMWMMELNHQRYTQRSHSLAEIVSRLIGKRQGQHLRRHLEAPFYVLAKVDMPSILVETAFISNKNEERKLRDPVWRENTAKAIADGVLQYRQEVEGSLENLQARR